MIKDKSIFVKNIYYMLSYAFTNLNPQEVEEVEAEDFENIHNLFAAILNMGIGRQLKQGLHREYLGHHETLTTLRGKIDMAGTLKSKFAQRQELVCNYDELSENNELNQILKATAFLLMRHPTVSPKNRDDLKKRMLFFSNVDLINPRTISWRGIRFNRNTRSYRMLISVCQLVLEGLLITTDSGEHQLTQFLDDHAMSRLYEKFLLEYFIKECPSVRARAEQIRWALDDDYGTMLPTMQTDITLSTKDKVLIIDAKYYTRAMQQNFGTYSVHSGNLYQIFTYVKNKEAEVAQTGKQVSGMLLYARTDEEVQPNSVYRMSGNQISVKSLDLNVEFSAIAAQLNQIVADHFLCDGKEHTVA